MRSLGNLAEWIGYFFLLVVLRADYVSEFPPWSESRRGVVRGIRAWARSTLIAAPLLTPYVLETRAQAPDHWIDYIVAGLLSIAVFGVASMVFAPALIWGGRSLRAPRPIYDVVAFAIFAALAVSFLGAVSSSNAEGFGLWPLAAGAFWGWLYWFFAHRPRPPYRDA